MPFNPRYLFTARLAVALLVGLLGVSVVQAEQADRNQPMKAEADTLRYDDANKTSVFTGHVVITKGTIIIRGAKVEVRQDPQGNQFGLVTGNRAFFRQKREGLDEFIEGQAQRIEYDSKADTVRFTGNAVLRRYKGSVVSDETSGGVIAYNNSDDTFSVDGGASNGSSTNPSGRVRAMLTPARKPGVVDPAASPAPLKPSNQLGEGAR